MPSQVFQLQIKHIGYQDDSKESQPQFVVLRGSDLKSSDSVTLTGPDQTVVSGCPHSNLQQDLRWYLELLSPSPFTFPCLKNFDYSFSSLKMLPSIRMTW